MSEFCYHSFYISDEERERFNAWRKKDEEESRALSDATFAKIIPVLEEHPGIKYSDLVKEIGALFGYDKDAIPFGVKEGVLRGLDTLFSLSDDYKVRLFPQTNSSSSIK